MTDLILPCSVKSEGGNMQVLDNSSIKAVIDEYARSEIQSEAEVRSKLVVEFKLEPISGQDNVLKMYESIDFVYDGFMLN